MVKRIIPGNMSPWECEINDVKYVYPPGTEQMVPDEVAHVIDAWYASQEPKYPEPVQPEWGGGGGGAQPDWNAAEGEPGHILNRPFYENTTTLFDQTVELPDAGGIGMLQIEGNLMNIGSTATVTFDGVEYECEVTEPMAEIKAVGNIGLTGEGEDNGLPFCLMLTPSVVTIVGQVGKHSVKVDSLAVNPIDEKFLPRMTYVVDVNGQNEDWFADRTFAEIAEALKKGRTVIATLGGYVHQLAMCSSNEIQFVSTVVNMGSTATRVAVRYIHITNDNTVTLGSTSMN